MIWFISFAIQRGSFVTFNVVVFVTLSGVEMRQYYELKRSIIKGFNGL
jgi:hypothetical protein